MNHRRVSAFGPDVIVYTAILNDLLQLYADRDGARAAYAGATRNLVDAANRHGARMVLVSTDWVFDASATAARLGVRLPSVRDQLGRMRAELDSMEMAA
jgi:dTDP-4-dehydrorhamnose reductase